MKSSSNNRQIRPGINARGFLISVKDYTEPAVIEELAANSYDADASTVLVLLDPNSQLLHIVDDGNGFSVNAIENAAVIGGGDKNKVDYSYGKRHYLGAYGVGLKSTAKISNSVKIYSVSAKHEFALDIDWKRLEEALKPEFPGFNLEESQLKSKKPTGTHIEMELRQPTNELLEVYHKHLCNLPDDGGNCTYYTGIWSKVKHEIAPALTDFSKLKTICRGLVRKKLLSKVEPNNNPDLKDCDKILVKDKIDPTVNGIIYFAGLDGDKVRPLKKGLRGIYVRIQGRLLKQSFTDQKYVYGISKWVKFASGIRVELSIDWLRNEISLSRDGLTFSNPKLEEEFRATISRIVSSFIGPQLKSLAKKSERSLHRRHSQRMELANRRMKNKASGKIKGIGQGFDFKPETDGELALLISNPTVLKKVNANYKLVDYNDQAPFDCLIYDESRREFIQCELEPTIKEFLQHKVVPQELKMIITWSLGKWRMGAKQKGVSAVYQLTASEMNKKGFYKLLAYKKDTSKTPHADYIVVALEDLFEVARQE